MNPYESNDHLKKSVRVLLVACHKTHRIAVFEEDLNAVLRLVAYYD